MGFFQNSVVNKHLKTLNQESVSAAYVDFKSYFHNAEIQKNIREAKEEQFQEGFLRELFVKILGYTLNPQPNYNLTTELKNETGAKKADGAILQDGKALAVIELKGTNTKDLDKINAQAFNYKNNQSGCVYVITSNFEKLRFFIHNSVSHLEFNLFSLSEADFKLLYLCLHAENLLGGLPLKVKEESVLAEENISKQLYKDYSSFKIDLWQNMVKNSPEADQLVLFKKTQKLLDRFLFIFFAEDSGLLPPNSISRMVQRFELLKEEDAYKPLYEIFKQYFEYINTGRKGKSPQDDIFAYNGGLFIKDELLDTILVDDEILHKHVMKLTAYDFQTEVDVNILGHIFENSLSEIENVIAKLQGQEVDKSKTKRKKDGVFYTPKYITKYIVENTIGKLCEEKKAELKIVDEDYAKGRKNRKKNTLKTLDKNLQAYRHWLLSVTICDPACGSGAFLNQALEFLIEEHAYIDELESQLLGYSFEFPGVETHILENNIYGVDINEESVEIAKLSLWLRTAQRGRKLTSLNNNLKCGNSLIDDPTVAGDKAFHWQSEFPEIFTEKVKKAYHITTATHNSRYSQRMLDNHVKLDEPVLLSEQEEIIVSETIAAIVAKDELNILAYNICEDHMHLLVVCEEEEVSTIIQKIKSVSARACNIAMGRTVPADCPNILTREHASSTVATPLSSTREHISSSVATPLSSTREHISSSVATPHPTREHAPLSLDSPSPKSEKEESKRGTAQAQLWTQKFGKNEIRSEEQLLNTIAYIQNNRVKHELPTNKKLDAIIDKIVMDQEQAFSSEYKGGFDVVIGNPPYVRQELLGEIKPYLEASYKVFEGTTDLFAYFYEKSFRILNQKGIFGFISNTFDKTKAAIGLREYLANETSFVNYVDFTEVQIFEGATTYPIILISRNKIENNNQFTYIKIHKKNESNVIDVESESSIMVAQNSLNPESWNFNSIKDSIFFKKISKNKSVKVRFGKSYRGVVTGFNDAFIIDETTKTKLEKEHLSSKELIKPFYEGKDLNKWYTPKINKYLIFTRRGTEIEKYPAIKEYLEANREKLTPKSSPEIKVGRKPGPYKWFEIQDPVDYFEIFEQPKITWPNLQSKSKFSIDNNGYYINAPSVVLPFANKTLLCILNSKVVWFFLKSVCVVRSGGYIEVKPQYFEQIPIPELRGEESFNKKAGSIISSTSKLQHLQLNFSNYLQSQFTIETISKKLQNWHELSFAEFIAELNKAIKKAGGTKLSKADEMEWMELFETKKAEAQALKSEIDKTDKAIDQMVYQLYGLTEEEIAIVENSVK